MSSSVVVLGPPLCLSVGPFVIGVYCEKTVYSIERPFDEVIGWIQGTIIRWRYRTPPAR